MSFKIRPNYERAFSSKSSVTTPSVQKTEMVEDVVFVVDEETGEIREETQYVEQQVTQTGPVKEVEQKKESARVLPLSMKKRNMVSFM